MTMPTRRFANDDEAAQHWLTLLREGDGDQKIAAREQLAAIFERRGMYEEAADLLASNVRDGIRNADIFRWLARLYRAQGDEVTAMQAAAEAAKYMTPPPAAVYAPPPVPPSAPAQPAPYQTPPPRKAGMSAKGAVGIGCLGILGFIILLNVLSALTGGSTLLNPRLAGTPGISASGSAPSQSSAAGPAPTVAARPTATPIVPTPTAPPPTARPSVHLEGRGRTATDPLIPPLSVSVMKFQHEGNNHVAVKALRSGGPRDELLVNTVGRYVGARPITGDDAVTFDIQADGRWVLDLVPIARGDTPAFSGKGDDVSAAFEPPSRGPWTITHDGAGHFAIKLHCTSGTTLVENRVGATNGSTVVTFGRGPCFWEVVGDGSWKLAPR